MLEIISLGTQICLALHSLVGFDGYQLSIFLLLGYAWCSGLFVHLVGVGVEILHVAFFFFSH
jgi:hypothetical protein